MNAVTSDHDTLIRVETKLDSLVTTVKEIKDGTSTQLADHEKRINAVENIVTEVKPIETIKEFRKLQLEVRDWKTTANAFRLISGFIGGAIMYLLSQVPALLKSWGIL